MPDVIAALLGALTGFAAFVATDFSVTSQGPNPWDLPSFINALRISPQVLKALGSLGGTIDSMFRSPAVNEAVGGVSNSYHQHGLAVDIKPDPARFPTVEAAFRYTAQQVLAGFYGPDVRTVIWEPSWVHLDFFKKDEARRPPNFLKKGTDANGKTTYSKVTV